MLSILKHKTFLNKKTKIKLITSKFKNLKELGCVFYNVKKYQQLNLNFFKISFVN